MRKLKTSDIAAFCRVLKAVGIKDEIQKIAQGDKKLTEWERGFNLIYKLFDLITEKNGEAKLYEFLAEPFEMSADAIADMPIPEFFDCCKQLAEENDLKNFFSYAAQLMK